MGDRVTPEHRLTRPRRTEALPRRRDRWCHVALPDVTRTEALRIAEALLQREGADEALAVVREVFEVAEASTASADTVTRLTRALLENEKTYRLVFSHELEPMAIFDPATRTFLDVNASFVELYGYTREEIRGLSIHEVSSHDPELAAHAITSLPRGATDRVDLRWHRAKDGTVFPVEVTVGKLPLGDRDVMYAVMRDITQRENAQRALARSEASFRGLIESLPDGVLVHRHGTIVYMNTTCRSMLGYSAPEEVVGMPALEIVHPDDRAKVYERVVEMISSGDPAAPAEVRLVRDDGGMLLAEIGAIHTVFDGEPAVLALARDVTQRKEMDAQLVLNDRLASIGRLAASVGHELNNPLASVLGNISLIERELAKEGLSPDHVARLSPHLEMIKEAADRMRDIVSDLRTLARGDSEQGTAVDVQHMLDVCVNLAEHEIRTRARVVKEYGEPVFAFGTEARLGQVFLNLLLNAAQSIPEGDVESNEIRVCVGALGDERISIAVSDTGAGIRPEHRDRVFEPFFTTKVGSGTGLGLAIAHRIVTSAGGVINVEPQPRGTLVRVVLPSYVGAVT